MISPLSKILYLISVASLCFIVRNPYLLSGLLVLQLVLWLHLRLPLTTLGRTFKRLILFIIFVLLTFTLFPSESMPNDVWMTLSILDRPLTINLTGLMLGILMSLRVLTVVTASMVVQLSGTPGELVQGLRAIKIPIVAAMTIDNVLKLLGSNATRRPNGGSGTGRGGGKGGGQGRKQNQDDKLFERELTWKRIVTGDFGFLTTLIESALTRATALHQPSQPSRDPKLLHDVAVISGLCFLMMTTKMLKVLPGIPFAPGYKLVVLIPLYILAGQLTYSRFGATTAGTTIGIVSFLFGDGRFGIFEIFKHIAPGLVVDGIMPALKGRGLVPSRFLLALIGALCAAARIATILVVTWLIDPPAVFYALFLPMFISQMIFGFISGWITFYLLKSLSRFTDALLVQDLESDLPMRRANPG
jgi:Cobalt transport protein